jgi:hypothetical protein
MSHLSLSKFWFCEVVNNNWNSLANSPVTLNVANLEPKRKIREILISYPRKDKMITINISHYCPFNPFKIAKTKAATMCMIFYSQVSQTFCDENAEFLFFFLLLQLVISGSQYLIIFESSIKRKRYTISYFIILGENIKLLSILSI